MISEIKSPIGKLKVSSPDLDKSITPDLQKGYYEPVVQSLIYQFIKQEMWCLDLGANFGQHTALMGKIAEKVYAVEASPDNFKQLEDTICLNGLSNVITCNVGISDKEGTIRFSYNPENAGCSFFSETFSQKDETTTLIPCSTLDKLFPGVKIDFVKMDIEGSELKALNGGEEFFKKVSYLLVELNSYTLQNFNNAKVTDVVKKIKSLGFTDGCYYNSNIGGFAHMNIDQIGILLTGAEQNNQPIFVDMLFYKEEKKSSLILS
jgi:FkbM family methyltransferase